MRDRLLRFAETGKSAAGNRWKRWFHLSQYITAASQIQQLGISMFLVPSSQSAQPPYAVDAAAGMCECHVGRDGSFCKHQIAVQRFFGVEHPSAPTMDSATRRHAFAVLAVGEEAPSPAFYGPLTSGSASWQPIQGQGRIHRRQKLSKTIMVQPTAVSRRRPGSSRSAQPARVGRPRSSRALH